MSFKKLLAYQKGFDLEMDIFHLTKEFPKSEQFLLTSQMVDQVELCVLQLLKLIENVNMKNILKVNCQMLIVKIQKLNCG